MTSTDLGADDVGDLLRHANDLLAAGRGRQAVDLLADATDGRDAPELERALVGVRHRAATNLDGLGRVAPVPVGPDSFVPGTIPELPRADLTAERLADALAHHGSLLVRGFLDPGPTAHLLDGVHRAFEASGRFADGAPPEETSPWYAPFDPTQGFAFGAMERGFARSLGGVLSVESPRGLAWVITTFRQAGVGDLLDRYFGEWPVLSAKKSTLRRATPASPTEWHQDGAFLGADTRTVNVWVALTPCGRDAPGIEVFPHAFREIVETGTDDALFPWSVSPTRAASMAVPDPIRPEFAAGDALLFNQMTLHRTDVNASMTADRYAIESWFFAPSTYPYEQVPILF